MRCGRHSTISAAQREEFWRRYKAGESVLGIIGALGQRSANINRVLEASGGIAPVPKTRSQRVLRFGEREEISRGLAAGDSLRMMPGSSIEPSLRSAKKWLDTGDEGGIELLTQIQRLGSRRVDPSPVCSARSVCCSGSLQLNCSRTGLRSKLQAGSETTIPVIRRCGCHTRRFIEAFSSRHAVP